MNNHTKEIAVFGGGCFWCTEAVFKMLKGIQTVEPGYSGGEISNPTYEQVSNGDTGHAEVIHLEYNPDVITYRDLLTVFFGSHEPTTKNRQGNDVGTQYRSVIFYTTDEQKKVAENFIQELNDSHAMGSRIVTELSPLTNYFSAESYHKDYFAENPDNPYCEVIINPKLEKVQKHFAELLNDKSKRN